MTGQAQMAGYSQGDFKKAVCDHLSGGLFDCSKLYVSVNAYSSFGLADTSTPLDTTTGTMTVDVNNLPFSTGGPGSIIVVQLYYQWPIFVSLLNSKLADINGNRLLVATSVLRNEPYQ